MTKKPNQIEDSVVRVDQLTGSVMYKVTEDLLKEIEDEAKLASGVNKYNLYRKLRIFKLNVGKWLVKRH
jgi:hypothetical protein